MDKDKVYTGTICWFSAQKGYGFISWKKDGKDQTDMFLHFSDIQMEGFKQVKKDDKVQFSVGVNNRGVPKAINCLVLK